MVCPNCHSRRIIKVQDQNFCINCGQMIPSGPGAGTTGGLAVQPNGLPEGVEILGAAADEKITGDSVKTAPIDTEEPHIARHASKRSSPLSGIIHPRKRILHTDSAAAPEATDTHIPAHHAHPLPRHAHLKTMDVISKAPLAVPVVAPKAPRPLVTAPLASARRMDDIARRPQIESSPASMSTAGEKKTHAQVHKPAHAARVRPPKRQHIHKVGVAPLHYGQILGATLRAHVKPMYIVWGMVSMLTFAGGIAYIVWLYLTQGPVHLAHTLEHVTLLPELELVTLTGLYYIGRSLGQTAITYGVIRHGDDRPISLNRQFAIGVNTFGRRLRLDLSFAAVYVVLAAIIAGLVIIGGKPWSVPAEYQYLGLFCAFLFLVYAIAALSMAKGLASVAITTSSGSVLESVRLGWQLFAHRVELLGFRVLAVVMELLLCVPLALLALVCLVYAPATDHLLVTIAIGGIALLAGALIGVGTSAWWASLYRRLVITDRPNQSVSLLSSRQPSPAHEGALAFIVMLATLLVCVAAALPWLRLT